MSSGSGPSGWNFDHAFDPPSNPASTPPPLPYPQPTPGAPFGMGVTQPTPQAPYARPGPVGLGSPTVMIRRGQRLSWICLILAVVCSVVLGIALYNALASESYASISSWLTVVVFDVLVAAALLILSIIGVARAWPRLVAVLALIGILVLPSVAAFIGIKFGLDVLAERFQEYSQNEIVQLALGYVRRWLLPGH
jgi:hypothetical protein